MSTNQNHLGQPTERLPLAVVCLTFGASRSAVRGLEETIVQHAANSRSEPFATFFDLPVFDLYRPGNIDAIAINILKNEAPQAIVFVLKSFNNSEIASAAQRVCRGCDRY